MQIFHSAGRCANISIHRFDSAVPSKFIQKMYFAASNLIFSERSHVDWFFIKEGQKMVDSSLYLIHSPHTSSLVRGTTDPDAGHKMAALVVLFSSL